MVKRRCFLLVAFALVAFGQALAAQQEASFSSLEKTIQAELVEARIPGAAVAIVRGDKVVFAKGFGTSNAETHAPVTPDMLFRVGSVTKMFTTAALTILAEQGKIDLDAPIGQYVKNLPPQLSHVSTHQLMSHTAGLRDDAPSYGLHDAEAMGRVIRSWSDDYFFTQPGRVFSYSNPGLTLAGYVAQESAGRAYARLVDDLLLRPLGMNATTFEPTLAMTRPLVQGHNVVADTAVVVRPFADNAGYWPSGFLFSSVTDLARFTIAFMNGGRIEGRDVLSRAVVTKMSTGYAPTLSGAENAEYGYGLITREYRGVRVVEHGGSIQGFGALVRMVPEQQFAIITLTNRSGGQLPKSTEAAMELFLPLARAVAAKAATPALTRNDLEDLPGRYAQGANVLDISERNGKLYLRQGAVEQPLQKIADSRFAVTTPQRREFIIVRGTTGRVEYLHTGMRALARQP